MTGTHRFGIWTPRRSGRRTTWRERAFVLGGLALALLGTAVLIALSTGTHLIGPLWFGAIVWTVVAQIAHVLWLGIRHKDWSGFGDCQEPDREDEHDWASRTGRYSYRRHFEDRHLHDTDHIRNHDRNPPGHGAAFSS